MDNVESEPVSGKFTFRGLDYLVTVQVVPCDDGSEQQLLVVDVEDKTTAEQWRGEFQPLYIKELTQKTGNFKQFHVFVDMLKSVVTKTSSSVSLDLMTFSDLEQLRSHQGHKSRQPVSKPVPHVANKRYLILTYTVEFDRVHYPLPLPYIGKPDPAVQQTTIRKLRSELANLKRQLSRNHRRSEYSHLQASYDELLREKEELEAAYGKFQLEVKHSQTGNATKEIRVLKKVIHNLEADLLKERSQHQRSSRKKMDENRSLLQELEELRTSERNLRVRVKSLTNELAMLRRSRGLSGNGGPSGRRRRSASSDSEAGRSGGYSGSKPRSNSATRKPFTPSSAGARFPRFNPTAYVQDKQRKQKEADIRLGQGKSRQKPPQPRSRSNSFDRQPRSQVRRSLISDSSPPIGSSGAGRYYGYQRRTSSVGSRSGRSSRGSSTDRSSSSLVIVESTPRGAIATKTRSSRPTERSRGTAWASPVDGPKRYGKPSEKHSRKEQKQLKRDNSGRSAGSADRSRDDEFVRRSAEINEIDARLNKLKRFMKSSLES
ncbi:centrosomal protein CCDC61-like [Corticium candelabrum]|uniref:centrosomal protein CCDC61-like n=1 Tax=Corticium candelabrum TaxID=121492 RepID=UPI002E257EDD|nr:centrosomal protein CCDC61-like [Corticium candelabrum]